jgi:translation initiation factor eIF-2B subunit gamma
VNFSSPGRIKTDAIVISCDTITDVSLYPLINQFREKDASLVALFIPPSNHSVVHPCSKNKNKPEKDLVGINEKNQRLVFLASASDFEENVKLPAHMLRSNREVLITTNLTDAHIYIVKKWIVDFLAKTKACSTIKGELLPFIVRKQMSQAPCNNEPGKPWSEAKVNPKTGNIFDVSRVEFQSVTVFQ